MSMIIEFQHINYGQCHRCIRPAEILRRRKVRRRDGSQSVDLTTICVKHAPKDIVAAFGISHQEYHNWVLYVDLPTGQVSFHAAAHGEGPLYRGEWDGSHQSAERILLFCDQLASAEMASGAGAAVPDLFGEAHP